VRRTECSRWHCWDTTKLGTMTAHSKSGAIATTHLSSPSRHGRFGMTLALVILGTFALIGAAACGGDGSGSNGPSGDFVLGEQDAPSNSDISSDSDATDDESSVIVSDAGESGGGNTANLASLNRLGGEPYRPDLYVTTTTGFINTEPFTLDDLEGQVILIDFWTYTCINCIRTFPFLKDWHEKYADDGLVIVGVHTPEFEFEKVLANVEQAVAEFGIEYRVVQDNNFVTWTNYQNRFWPAKYLIDRDGFIRYTHFGEGDYDETETIIKELLAENGGSVTLQNANSLPTPEFDEAALEEYERGDRETQQTVELYAGTERNYQTLRFGSKPYVAHQQFYSRLNLAMEYADPDVHKNHSIYLNGLWTNGPESLTHARTTEGYEDYVAIVFYGTSAHIVLGLPASGEPYEVRVTIADAPIAADHAGEDVLWDDDGNSYLLVDEDRLYRVAKTPRYGGYELKLSSNSDTFEFFAFTFGVFDNAP
jgi:thiol-disulfide isomerase/thioredoxin